MSAIYVYTFCLLIFSDSVIYSSPVNYKSFEGTYTVNSEASQAYKVLPCDTVVPGTSQLVTRSTRHTVKSCDELTVVCDGIVTS